MEITGKVQRDYFRTRSIRPLNESKRLEAQVDAEIERVEEVLKRQADNQQLNNYGNNTKD